MAILHEKVHPLIVVLVHRLIDNDPCVLLVKKRDDSQWSLMSDHMRVNEQPYGAGLRVINNTLDMNLNNIRLRCYFCNTIFNDSDDSHTLAVYYTLKLREKETNLLDKMLGDNISSMRIEDFKWVSVKEPRIEDVFGENFNSKMSYCWETMRKAVASNYGIRVSK